MDARDKVRAWAMVDELVLDVYAMTRKIPSEEPTELPAALRAAALRSAVRIVQGLHGRGADFVIGLQASLGSLAELRYCLYLAKRLGLIDLRRYRAVCARLEKAQKLLRDLRTHETAGHVTGPLADAQEPASPSVPSESVGPFAGESEA